MWTENYHAFYLDDLESYCVLRASSVESLDEFEQVLLLVESIKGTIDEKMPGNGQPDWCCLPSEQHQILHYLPDTAQIGSELLGCSITYVV